MKIKHKHIVGIFSIIPVIGVYGNQNRPNIIFFLTDDQRYNAAGFAGNEIIRTPVMDSLAAAGVQFRQCFVTTPISAASRASIFTGMYERSHGFTFGTDPVSQTLAQSSYPQLLRDAGYHTGYFAKFGIKVADNLHKNWFDVSEIYEHRGYWRKHPADPEKSLYLTDYTARNAINFIRDAPEDKPFFLCVGFNAPHASDKSKEQYFWAPEEDGLYLTDSIPAFPPSDKEYFDKLPEFVQKGENRVRWKWRFDTPQKFQHMVKGYYRMISGVDRAMGNILKEVRNKGIAKNTIIIFMSDNGYFIGDRGLADKWLMYDVSLRVPLVVVSPEVRKSKRISDELVLNIDIPSTILDLAGIEIPVHYQGKSLKPLLTNGNKKFRNDFFCEHLMNWEMIPQSEGVRTRKWKYFRYRNFPEWEELYNLEKDPLEQVNLAGNPEYKAELNRLRSRCDEYIDHLNKEKK